MVDYPRNPHFILLLLFISFFSFAQITIPDLQGKHVHDEADILTPRFIKKLEAELSSLEDSSGCQIALLIINSLKGYPLEKYSLNVAEKWKLGTAKDDNGVLLLIVLQEHKIRLEIGQGLEEKLTDIRCSQIIRNELAPHFRKNNYEKGITNGIKAIRASLSDEYTTSKKSSNLPEPSTQAKALFSLYLVIVLSPFIFLALKAKGVAAWIIYILIIPFFVLFPISIFGDDLGLLTLFIYLISFPPLKILFNKKGWSTLGSNQNNIGGWGGQGNQSSDGGWSSGGGFSGGGGSFGGGGSSGFW